MSARGGSARRALAVVLAALGVSCAAPPPVARAPAAEAQVTQALAVARRAYERGEYAQARALYRQALTRARAIDHAALAADAAYNLAVSEIALQDYDAAEQRLREAQYDAARASTDVVEPLLLRAKVAHLRGQAAEALALAGEVLGAAAPPGLHLQARLLRGQIHAESGELARARAELLAVAQGGSAPRAPALAADAHKLEGTIARREGRHAAAARLFEAEAALLQDARRYRDRAQALARAAQAHLEAGDAGAAAERYFLAARSLDALGDAAAARTALAGSLAAAARAGDARARARAQALLDEISRRAVP